MIRRSKHGAVYVRPYNTTELRHRIGKPDPNACSNRAIESADAFWPDDRIGRPGTGSGDYQGEVFDNGVGDGDEDDVAYYRCAFDWKYVLDLTYNGIGRCVRTGDCRGPWPDPFLVDHISDCVEKDEACYIWGL